MMIDDHFGDMSLTVTIILEYASEEEEVESFNAFAFELAQVQA